MRLIHTQKIIFALLLSVSSIAMATVQQHTFGISGTNGETGSGTFTWDDAVVSDDSFLLPTEVLSASIAISGGTVIGGSTSFVLGDCSGLILALTPDFASAISFVCDNGTNALTPVASSNTSNLNGGTSVLTFTAGSTVPVTAATASVPTLPTYGLVLTMLGLLLVAARRLSASDKRK